GSFGVDYPILAEQRAQKGMESFLFGESLEAPRKQQFAVTERMFEPGDELATEDAAEYFHRQEEGIARGNPSLVVSGKGAGWNHAVNMRVMLKILSPGVENTQEADVGAKMLWVGSNLQQGCGTAAEQEVIYDLLVLQGQPR